MAMDTWRLSRIQDELDQLDLAAAATTQENYGEGQGPLRYLDNAHNPSSSASLAADKPVAIKDASGATTVGRFIGGEGYSDDEESLPPYPEVNEDDCFLPDNGEDVFPTTPVPAQIGVVRPLPAHAQTQQMAPLKEDIYSVAIKAPKSEISQLSDEAQAVQIITEKYDSLERLKALNSELTTIPVGYVNMNSPSKLVPTRTAPPVPIDKLPMDKTHMDPALTNTAQLVRPKSQDHGALSFSAIIEQNSPARSLSMALANNPPPSPIPMSLKRGNREHSWSSMEPSLDQSKGLLPGDITGHSLIPISLKRGGREHSFSDMETNSNPSKEFLPGELSGPSSNSMSSKRGNREHSWSDMEPKSNPSKGLHPVDLTGYPSSSITKSLNSSSLTEHEILQVEMFYRSHKAEVFVCHCAADLYYGSMQAGATSSSENFYTSGSDSLSNWKLIKPGIPVLLLDSCASRRERKLHLVVAERGTGFALWREQINARTDYQAREAMFHTMHLSSDHSKLAALKFHDAGGASDFLQKLNSILTNPDTEDMFSSAGKKKKKKEKKKEKSKGKTKLPDKKAISAPCCFTHITNLDRNDGLGVLEISTKATKTEGTS